MTGTSRERLQRRIILGAALCLIVMMAAALRLHDLGLRTFQPAESELSLIAMQASEMRGYEYLPATHGPLPHFASAAAFLAGGDSDVTARLMPALAGILLAMLPFAFRRELGPAGTVAAALGLAVSPTLLYYSRFANPEIYTALFAFATAIAIWRYMATSKRAWLYALSFALALMFVSSEMALVIAPIFAAYLYYRTAVSLRAQMDAAEPADVAPDARSHYATLGVAPDAAVKAIRKSYRDLIDATDSRGEREAIAHAYGVLTNEQRRAAYDRALARQAMRDTEIEAATPGTRAGVSVAALAGPIALAWPFLRGMRARLGLRRLPATADTFIVLTLLALPFYGPLVQKLPFVGDRGFAGQQMIYVIGGETQTPGGEVPVMMLTLGALFAIGAIAGIAWKWHAWVICAAVFYGTTIAFFTGFFTNSGGMWTGYWGTLDYWYRPEADFTAGPSYYYAMVLPVYEFLPLIVAALGAAYLAVSGSMRDRIAMAAAACALAALAWMPASAPVVGPHREALALVVSGAAILSLRIPEVTKFLAFWAACAFFAFTIVPARDPWLTVHIAVPLTLLSARLLNDAIAAIPVPAMPQPRPQFSIAFGPRMAQAGMAAMFVVVALVSMQSGVLASWGRPDLPQLDRSLATRDAGDTPVELLAPLQTAPDVREIRDAVDRAVAASDDGAATPIIVDTSYEFASSWLWYLRGYEGLQLRDMRKPATVPANAIVLADSRNRTRIEGADMLLSLTYTQRWAFPQKRYSGYSARGIAAQMIDPSAWGDWTAYIGDRSSVGDLPATSGVAFFPRALEAALPPSRQSDVLSIATGPEAAP